MHFSLFPLHVLARQAMSDFLSRHQLFWNKTDCFSHHSFSWLDAQISRESRIIHSLVFFLLFIWVQFYLHFFDLAMTDWLVYIFELIHIASWSEVFHWLIKQIIQEGQALVTEWLFLVLFLLFSTRILRFIGQQVLIDKPLQREYRNYFSCFPVNIERVDSKIEPRQWAKIHCFAYIEAGWKSTVIASWKSNNELARMLNQPIHIDSILSEKSRRHHGGHMMDEIGFILLEWLQLLLH